MDYNGRAVLRFSNPGLLIVIMSDALKIKPSSVVFYYWGWLIFYASDVRLPVSLVILFSKPPTSRYLLPPLFRAMNGNYI